MAKKEIYGKLESALAEWIRGVVHGAGRQRVVVGLSGGIDSGVTAAVCARALGPGNVLGLVLPCASIPEDTRDGHSIGSFLGVQVKEIDLTPVLDLFIEAGGLDPEDRLNIANVKARLRMTMIYAHTRNALVAGTGNMSETVTGYWTKWGDGAADLLPLGDLWKEEVAELASFLGLPEWILNRVPSAGLWKGQSDEDEMGVTYGEISRYHRDGPESVPREVGERIAHLFATSAHKRDPIPVFQARRLLDV